MIIPWGELSSNPELTVLVPFLWILWQLYLPRIVPGYETWWTKTRQNFMAEIHSMNERFDDVAKDVSEIAETQQDLIDVTVAQTEKMNGHDGEMDIENVKEQLYGHRDTGPHTYLKDKDDTEE